MRKLVSTQMTDKEVIVDVESIMSGADDLSAPDTCTFVFPFSLVNPRVALQIATLLVSDPTIPECHGKKEDK